MIVRFTPEDLRNMADLGLTVTITTPDPEGVHWVWPEPEAPVE